MNFPSLEGDLGVRLFLIFNVFLTLYNSDFKGTHKNAYSCSQLLINTTCSILETE